MAEPAFDVVVVGGGNAALCAALAAREGGARVVVLEKAPEPQRGGNSFFTAGGFRFVHGGLDDLRKDLLTDLSDEEADARDRGAVRPRPGRGARPTVAPHGRVALRRRR